MDQSRGRRWRNVLGIGLGLVMVVGFGAARLFGGAPDAPVSSCDGEPTPWHDAAQVVGERAAVAGPVAAASHQPDVGGAPTFLNLGNAHPVPERFDVVIYEDVRAEFDMPPEEALATAEVCAQGRVRKRDGVPQLVLESARQIIEQ